MESRIHGLYFLGMVRSGYTEFGIEINNASGRPAKTDFVKRTILDQIGEFTLADL